MGRKIDGNKQETRTPWWPGDPRQVLVFSAPGLPWVYALSPRLNDNGKLRNLRTVMKLLIERLELSFSLYQELVEYLDEPLLASRLSDLPSNTIGQQLWCVVGARESYARAIEKGAWAGFSCSLTREQIGKKSEILKSLHSSSELTLSILPEFSSPTEVQERLALQLLEHESQHHGQLIRYLYGLKVGVPKGWRERYSLD